jgi:hypothetical protein
VGWLDRLREHRRLRRLLPSRADSRRRKIAYVAVLVGTAAAVVSAVAAVAGDLDSGSSGTPSMPARAVKVTAAYVRNEAEETYLPELGLRGVQTLASTPTMDVEIHDSSSRPAQVREVRITVEGYAHVQLCFSQGAGGIFLEPPPHVIALPQYPKGAELHASSRLEVPVPAEGSADIPIRISTRRANTSEFSLYKIRAQLIIEGDHKPLQAGSFVVSAPARVPAADGYFPIDNSYFAQFVSRHAAFKSSWLQVYWCMRRNATLIEGLLKQGTIAPEFAVLRHPVLASEWSHDRDRLPLRRAASTLLAEQEPELAAFVASLTRDAPFEATVRERAAQKLLQEAEKSLKPESEPVLGELDARKAQALESTARGASVLAELERRVQAASAERADSP